MTESFPVVFFRIAAPVTGRRVSLEISGACHDLFGFAAEDAVKHPLRFLRCVHPAERSLICVGIRSALAEHRGWKQAFRTTAPGGSVRWLSVQSTFTATADGGVL